MSRRSQARERCCRRNRLQDVAGNVTVLFPGDSDLLQFDRGLAGASESELDGWSHDVADHATDEGPVTTSEKYRRSGGRGPGSSDSESAAEVEKVTSVMFRRTPSPPSDPEEAIPGPNVGEEEGLFLEAFDSRMHRGLSGVRSEGRSLLNRLRSIRYDANYVTSVVASRPHWPVIGNRRAGAWYVDHRAVRDHGAPAPIETSPPASLLPPLPRDVTISDNTPSPVTCWFKSTDGHVGQWAFSPRRLNLHVARAATQSGGVFVIDSTRSGKRFPDSLTATLPIWCAVLNATFLPDVAVATAAAPTGASPTAMASASSPFRPATPSLMAPLGPSWTPLTEPDVSPTDPAAGPSTPPPPRLFTAATLSPATLTPTPTPTSPSDAGPGAVTTASGPRGPFMLPATLCETPTPPLPLEGSLADANATSLSPLPPIPRVTPTMSATTLPPSDPASTEPYTVSTPAPTATTKPSSPVSLPTPTPAPTTSAGVSSLASLATAPTTTAKPSSAPASLPAPITTVGMSSLAPLATPTPPLTVRARPSAAASLLTPTTIAGVSSPASLATPTLALTTTAAVSSPASLATPTLAPTMTTGVSSPASLATPALAPTTTAAVSSPASLATLNPAPTPTAERCHHAQLRPPPWVPASHVEPMQRAVQHGVLTLRSSGVGPSALRLSKPLRCVWVCPSDQYGSSDKPDGAGNRGEAGYDTKGAEASASTWSAARTLLLAERGRCGMSDCQAGAGATAGLGRPAARPVLDAVSAAVAKAAAEVAHKPEVVAERPEQKQSRSRASGAAACSDPPFIPVVCVCASEVVEGGLAPRQGWSYVQGAGDDEEAWARGLTPSLFWKHLEELMACNTSDQCERVVKRLVAVVSPLGQTGAGPTEPPTTRTQDPIATTTLPGSDSEATRASRQAGWCGPAVGVTSPLAPRWPLGSCGVVVSAVPEGFVALRLRQALSTAPAAPGPSAESESDGAWPGAVLSLGPFGPADEASSSRSASSFRSESRSGSLFRSESRSESEFRSKLRSESHLSACELLLPVVGDKRDKHSLQDHLPAALEFILPHLRLGRPVLIQCESGGRVAICAAAVALLVWAAEVGVGVAEAISSRHGQGRQTWVGNTMGGFIFGKEEVRGAFMVLGQYCPEVVPARHLVQQVNRFLIRH